MERRLLVYFLVLILFLCLTSCESRNPHIQVIQGNYDFGRGKYQNATVHYLNALQQEEFSDWISYNLGNVYHSLGEPAAALSMWDDASITEEEDILFGLHFNRGVLFYEQGKYNEAFNEFKEAVLLDSNSVDAKVNLELAYRKVQAGSAAGTAKGESEGENPEETAESARILDYIRRKESGRWFASESSRESGSVNDW